MLDKLNAALIETIHSHTPRLSNPAALLMDILHIGREAAYRRLRGEVLFTFEEAAMIGEKLHFSLDQLMCSPANGHVHFKLLFENFQSPLEAYQQMLEHDAILVEEQIGDPTLFYSAAGNSIPPEAYLKFPLLADFKLFKWLYQHDLCTPDQRSFEKFVVPQSLHDTYRHFVTVMQTIPVTHYVFDNVIFMQWINAIRAFRDMYLVSKEQVAALRDELSLMIADMDEVMTTGTYHNGNIIHIYLSDIDLVQSCCYLSGRTSTATRIGLFSLNALRTTDAMMCDYVMRWIQTQGRFATMVSRSGELQRINYLKRQREALSLLDA